MNEPNIGKHVAGRSKIPERKGSKNVVQEMTGCGYDPPTRVVIRGLLLPCGGARMKGAKRNLPTTVRPGEAR
jgi:hypothetical protein